MAIGVTSDCIRHVTQLAILTDSEEKRRAVNLTVGDFAIVDLLYDAKLTFSDVNLIGRSEHRNLLYFLFFFLFNKLLKLPVWIFIYLGILF